MSKYRNISEIKSQKEKLKGEIKDLEKLMTFQNPKESLSLITNGYTDNFLKEVSDKEGNIKTKIDTKSIIQGISHQVKSQVNKKTIMQVTKSEEGNDLMKNALKLGAATLITNYAQKSMKSSTWKKKLIGAALLYVAPVALKIITKKIDEYQKNKTTESIEKLI